MNVTKLGLSLAFPFVICIVARAITIDTVPVGDMGNSNDLATGNLYGGVDYAYNIGKYEVTVGQYAAFLNAVAASDSYDLYNGVFMGDYFLDGSIVRLGSPGSWSYVVQGSPNYPVIGASWADAARFANWLHNGQPIGPEGPSTTETGAYTLNGTMDYHELLAVKRNPEAKWFIPTENEWYKAAYYQPAATGGDADGYWAYPMRTNDVPYSDTPPGETPDNTRVGNFFKDDGAANGYDDGYAVPLNFPFTPTQLTEVGTYLSSSSYYGTFDQGGNVFEWNEAVLFGARGLRGGDYGTSSEWLLASSRWQAGPTFHNQVNGFRVASIPEPNAMVLTVVAVGIVLGRKQMGRRV